MCGVAGSVQCAATGGEEAIREQLACQRHRGPDAQGWFAGRGGVVGQNRLSIIDLERGDPPVTDEAGEIGAVLNGEIYNFREVRQRLLAEGHRLSTAGDTEVLAHLAETLDAREIARAVDGMFAFAIWDRRRRRLLLGRDRFGKKPLYYWNGPGTFVFASEIKGVLAHPAVPCELDERALPAYLTFGYVPTPRSFFAGIKSLPPGHVLTLQPGEAPVIERYWQLQVPPRGATGRSLGLDLPEAARAVRRLLSASIERRLVADVPLGAFLSGGVDSSAIVALMSEIVGKPVKTFTIGFDDRDGFDERPYARAVARRFATEHHETVVHPSAVELVERLVWHHDQPFGDSSAIPTYLLNEVARQEVTVALSGDGGDELFAGYERFAGALLVERAGRLPPKLLNAADRGLGMLPPPLTRGRVGSARRFLAAAGEGLPWAYLEWISYMPEGWRRRLLHVPDDWARRDYLRRWERTSGAATLDRLLALNVQTYLLDDLLVKMDRTSMAHGLEVRSPFLDTELVEFAVRLPPSMKLRGLSLKRVLKHAVRDLLPHEILHRPKRGFGVPLDRWFREDLAAYTDSMLGPGARIRRHVNASELDRLLHEHRRRSHAHGHALWTLLTLELFLRRHGW